MTTAGATSEPGVERAPRQPTLTEAVLSVVVLIALIATTIVLFGTAATDGPLQVALFTSAAIAGLMALTTRASNRAAISEAVVGGISSAMQALFILLAVGALIGTFNMAGTIPTIVYYGIGILQPTTSTLGRVHLRAGRREHRQLVDDRGHARRRLRRAGAAAGRRSGRSPPGRSSRAATSATRCRRCRRRRSRPVAGRRRDVQRAHRRDDLDVRAGVRHRARPLRHPRDLAAGRRDAAFDTAGGPGRARQRVHDLARSTSCRSCS